MKISYYIDEGISEAVERPQYNKMMQDLERSDIHGVITPDLTRFGRSTVGILSGYQQIKDMGKELITISGDIHGDTPHAKFTMTILAAVAEFEKDMIRERMVLGREYAKIHGTKSGKPMHREKMKINRKQVEGYLKLGLNKTAIAKLLGINRKTLYNRLDEWGMI